MEKVDNPQWMVHSTSVTLKTVKSMGRANGQAAEGPKQPHTRAIIRTTNAVGEAISNGQLEIFIKVSL